MAVEVDGLEHRPDYDQYRDEYIFRRSGIVVIRVRNRNEEDASRALSLIARSVGWQERKVDLGITSKREAKFLASKPYPPSMLAEYLARLIMDFSAD
jgi:hypothetical protein